jgi:hypothetical protein
MSPRTRRILIILLLLLLALIVLLFTRCSRSAPVVASKAAVGAPTPNVSAEPSISAVRSAEVLTAATVQVPQQVDAGAAFRATWTGPDNAGDFLTIVRSDAKPESMETTAKPATVHHSNSRRRWNPGPGKYAT